MLLHLPLHIPHTACLNNAIFNLYKQKMTFIFSTSHRSYVFQRPVYHTSSPAHQTSSSSYQSSSPSHWHTRRSKSAAPRPPTDHAHRLRTAAGNLLIIHVSFCDLENETLCRLNFYFGIYQRKILFFN